MSVRGTSALDTVFHLGPDGVGPVFLFGAADPTTGVVATGEGTFLDKVAFVGVFRTRLGDRPEVSAAVAMVESFPAMPTITNCLFFLNRVGCAVIAPFEVEQFHEPTLINNTFSDCRICLWNGQYDAASPSRSGVGISRLLLVNNIFDAMPLGCSSPGLRPTSWPASFGGLAASDFEGVCAEDLTIAAPNPNPGDYNAYNFFDPLAARHYDYGGVILGNYPITTVRAGTAIPVPAATRNIAVFTGFDASNGLPRGVLFVRDLLCNGSTPGSSGVLQFPQQSDTTGWDMSPMDFRLAPNVAPAQQGTPATPSAPNPLIDNGYGDLATPLAAPITMANGVRVLLDPPGWIGLFPDQSTWAFSCWDEDGEGYGNRRFWDHPAYANGTGTPAVADIGFDEADELTIAGYRAMTRTFMRILQDNGSTLSDNRYVSYLGATIPFLANITIPQFRGYRHYTPPAAYSGTYDFTSGSSTYRTWVGTWAFQPTGPYYVPTLVDVTPHLLPDIHPWWHVSSTPVPSNPIWQPCDTRYNPFLYATPGADVANPHGTYPDPLFAAFEWIDESPTFRQFGSFGPYGGGPAAIGLFTSRCVGTVPPNLSYWDVLPATGGVSQMGGVALRFSVENDFSFFSFSAQKNIQTFQVIVQEEPQ